MKRLSILVAICPVRRQIRTYEELWVERSRQTRRTRATATESRHNAANFRLLPEQRLTRGDNHGESKNVVECVRPSTDGYHGGSRGRRGKVAHHHHDSG